MTDRFSRLFRPAGRDALPRFEASFANGSISEQVAHQIMGLIKAGRIRSGDRLPTEQQMTEALGISRQALREALKALTLMGVLSSRQGGRYMVSDLSPARLLEPFNVMLSNGDYDPAAHYEVRGVVELECVRLCAERASPEHRAEISRLAAEGRSEIRDPKRFGALDRAFHGAIYAGSGNAFLETIALALFAVAIDIRRGRAHLPDQLLQGSEDHARIATAIEEGRTERAVEAYRLHLVRVRDSTIGSLAMPSETAPA